jgi:hypothetical protein
MLDQMLHLERVTGSQVQPGGNITDKIKGRGSNPRPFFINEDLHAQEP